MQSLAKPASAFFLTGMFFTVTAATIALSGNSNPKPTEAASEKKNTAPEIHPAAAGAVGILIVGGIALMTTRRRARSASN